MTSSVIRIARTECGCTSEQIVEPCQVFIRSLILAFAGTACPLDDECEWRCAWPLSPTERHTTDGRQCYYKTVLFNFHHASVGMYWAIFCHPQVVIPEAGQVQYGSDSSWAVAAGTDEMLFRVPSSPSFTAGETVEHDGRVAMKRSPP